MDPAVGPMNVHRSNRAYFAALHADPYGFENSAYHWRGEDQFLAVLGPFYLIVGLGTLSLGQMGLIAPLNLASVYVFGASAVLELLGKVLCAYLVRNWNVKINYVRKLGLRPWRKLSAFIIPFFVTAGDGLFTDTVFLFCLSQFKTMAMEWHYIRRRVFLLRYAFVAWDRLEDRPYTLRYGLLEDILRFLVYIPFMVLAPNPIITLIPNLINEFGDGLAEPVGIRFGRHAYKTRALWYNGRFWNGAFQRTLEDSAMVFLATQVILVWHYPIFSPLQLAVALVAMPWLMTLAEAVSPHTADGPLLALVGCSFLLALQSLV